MSAYLKNRKESDQMQVSIPRKLNKQKITVLHTVNIYYPQIDSKVTPIKHL